MILQPQVAFPIVRQIANHLDSTVYYVRAVIRNASGTTIDTVNLDSQGDQRYQASWQVVADPLNQGLYISIVTSVYTDSGYTTKSPDYGDEENTYLVADRVSMRHGGAFQSSGIDARTVRRIMQEEYAKIQEDLKPEAPELPEMPEMDMTPMMSRMDDCMSAIEGLKTALKPEPPEKLDFKPLFDVLESLRNDVNAKEVTPPTDISPIMAKLQDKEQNDDITAEEMKTLLGYLADELEKNLPTKIAEMLKSTTFKIAPTTATMDAPKQKQPEAPAFNINQLAS